jgi:PhoPQ-activated pathogenicity-related protein
MVPLVFSMINIDGGTILQHNQNMDGGWSFVFSPYYNVNLTQELYNPKTTRLWDVEDMYRYRERLTLPILEMVSSGDEFFLLDDNHNWWNDIPDPKWLMMLPNAEHTMAPHYVQIYETMISFMLNILQRSTPPTVTWTMGSTPTGGYVELMTDTPPEVINAYWAVTLSNDTRRDFRLACLEDGDTAFHPVLWKQNLTIVDVDVGHYRVEVDETPDEWTGLFLEGEWVGPNGGRMVFTTQVNIIPDTYPRPICTDAESCYGYLV